MEENTAGKKDAPIFSQIIEILFGHKYWANIVITTGLDYPEICGPIWSSRKAAMDHRRQIEGTLSFQYLETVTFRSHATYKERPLKLW